MDKDKQKNTIRESITTAILYLLSIVAVIFLLSLLFAAIPIDGVSFWENVFSWSKVFFMFFGAPGVIAGIIMLFPKLSDEIDPMYTACGLYYGTAIIGSIIKKSIFPSSAEISYIIAFVLIIYIINIYRKG